MNFEELNTSFDVKFGEGVTINDGYNEGYEKGFEEGQNSVQNPLEYATIIMYADVSFPDGYELFVDIPYIETLNMIFRNTTGIKKITLKGNKEEKVLDFTGAFENSTVEIIDCSDFAIKPSNVNNVFRNATSLREIKGVIDMRSCTSANYPFVGCIALEEIRFSPLSLAYGLFITDSPLLSAETRQSIVEALLPIGGVLKLHSEVTAKFTPEQIIELTNKNWSIG